MNSRSQQQTTDVAVLQKVISARLVHFFTCTSTSANQSGGLVFLGYGEIQKYHKRQQRFNALRTHKRTHHALAQHAVEAPGEPHLRDNQLPQLRILRLRESSLFLLALG